MSDLSPSPAMQKAIADMATWVYSEGEPRVGLATAMMREYMPMKPQPDPLGDLRYQGLNIARCLQVAFGADPYCWLKEPCPHCGERPYDEFGY